MSFGLSHAPATFQHFVNYIFREFLDYFLIVYLDVILLFFSATLELHTIHVRNVLSTLRKHRLHAKAKKSEFEKKKMPIQFLGLILSTDRVAMDPQKVSAM